ncbi:MAG: ATP-binding protein [Cyanobacteria bacterium P01_G01_bin.39]
MTNVFSTKWQQLRSNLSRLTSIGFLKEARSRIMIMYALVMILFVATAIPAIEARVYQKVSRRVRVDLEEDLEEFEEEFVESLLNYPDEQTTDNVSNDLSNKKIYAIIDQIFATIMTEDDNFLIAIVDGQYYKSTSNFLPPEITPGSSYMKNWQNLTREEFGEIKLDDRNMGNLLYDTEPIKTTDRTLGVIVAIHTTAGEQQEAIESLDVIIETLIVILIVSLAVAWLTTGKILAPLRRLTNTAKAINESNLNRRFDVEGNGELAELSKTFNAMISRIESAFVTQRNFINDAGHELRTPITIIRGHLELTEVIDDDPQARQETIDLVIDELDRMNRLVDDLVLLARAERPDFLNVETIDLAVFVPELYSKLQALGERNWSFSNNVLSGQMAGDRQRITQAIINLANNAVQHTKADDTIAFTANLEQDRLILSIRDTGEGIPIKEQQRIFNRFARVKNTRRRSSGSGLGLSIVKAIVESHGGLINLQSQIEVGSTFTLIFPLEFNQQTIKSNLWEV